MAEGPRVARELKSEQAILSRFQDLRNELATLSGRANELAAESQEHDLVLKALEPLDGGRRCYRVVSVPSPICRVILHVNHWQLHATSPLLIMAQVGDVLVERTVAEVVPAVKGNKGQLDAVRFRQHCTPVFLPLGLAWILSEQERGSTDACFAVPLHKFATNMKLCDGTGGGAAGENFGGEEAEAVRVPGEVQNPDKGASPCSTATSHCGEGAIVLVVSSVLRCLFASLLMVWGAAQDDASQSAADQQQQEQQQADSKKSNPGVLIS